MNDANKERRRRARRLHQELRALLCQWDPIGVMADPQWSRDEYDCLLGPLLGRLLRGATAAELTTFLEHELREHFGLNPEVCEPAHFAAAALAWYSQYRAD